jgi:hypothetical protein
MNKIILSTIVAMAIGGLSLSAQKIEERKDSQQKRIAQGVASGQLTPGETKKIETKEQAINKEVRTERKANGGRLTQAEKKQVNRQQNRVSKQIHKEKNDAQTQK